MDVNEYLGNVKAQFRYYKLLGERTFEQLDEADFHWTYNEESNSIALIINHLHGNMVSRWTDFLTSDGEKEFRKRDQEFEETLKTKSDALVKWNVGWNCLFSVLVSIDKNNFDSIVYVRNSGHTIPEAINRQMAHYSYHIGQIVFIARMIKGSDWISLSIPKGKSSEYNAENFALPKKREHFAKEILDKKNTGPLR